MLHPTIVRVPVLPMGMVNCHLILGQQGAIVVDTGLPGSRHKIGRALARHGLGFGDIRLIVVTHAHVDHAGSAARLRELSGAPILAHQADAPYYAREKAMTFCPTGWFARLFLRTGLILQPYRPFVPDILLADGQSLDLAPYGVAGCARHTPGHTAGSVSLLLDSGDGLVGDLLASGVLLGGIVRKGQPIRPPFEDDPHAVAGQLQALADGGIGRFHLGHGGPLPAATVRRHAQWLLGLKRNGPCC